MVLCKEAATLMRIVGAQMVVNINLQSRGYTKVDDNIWLNGLFGCLMLTVFFTIILSLCPSVLVCLFCPLCVSVVTFDSEDNDKLEGCGGPSCSCKDDGLVRLVILHALHFLV